MTIVLNGEKFNLEDLEFLCKNSDGLLAIAIKGKEIIYKTISAYYDTDFNANMEKLFNFIKNNSSCQCFKFEGLGIINLSNLDNYLVHTTKKDDMLNVTLNFPTRSIKLDVSTKEMKNFKKQFDNLEKEEENEFII